MRITLVQQTIQPTKAANIDHIEELLYDPIQTDVIVLPEMCLSPYENAVFAPNAITVGDDVYDRLRNIAIQHNAYLVSGSVPERSDGQLFNTTFVFDPTGGLIATYRKRHLFSIAYPDGTTYNEADTITPGDDLVVVSTPHGRLGLMICFDIRFPMLAMRLRQQGAQVLIVPAAFNNHTGPLHWDLAFRSRAVDNQVFTVGVGPASDSAGRYAYYGHSIVVDPLGQILLKMNQSEQIRTIDLDLQTIENTRKALPIVSHEIML